MNILNNIIFGSLLGTVILLGVLWEMLWGETKKLEKTNTEPSKRLIWGLIILDGVFFFVFILSLFIKLINILFN